jgi:vitamin B12 transporter
MTIALLLATAAAVANPDILVTASLEPVLITDAAASATVIDEQRIRNLGAPLASDLIRLSPGVSVSTSGAQGSLTQIRIRGAEANHTLLFVDGIAFNDPASGNQARFETLGADSLGQIEILRGPQSALWGSEALGGVIALDSPDPLSGNRVAASGEYGSHDFRRAAFSAVTGSDKGGIAATASYLQSDGTDIFGGGRGDRDGFENLTASLKAVARPGADGEIGVVGRYIRADSEFDGTPPPFFIRADTLDASRAETGAARAWARLGLGADAPWSAKVEGQYLRSENRNWTGSLHTNDTIGDRFRVGGQIVRRMTIGQSRHELIAEIEREDETFENVDLSGGGAASSRNTRGRTAFVGEWRGTWGTLLVTDLAVRRDDFNRFADATTIRANALLRMTPKLSLQGSYGEGIAQPSFADLYGFSPGSGFVPNPALTPEKSRGFEAGIRWEDRIFSLQAVAFSNNLRDEVVEDFATLPFPAYTVVNASGKSRRRGIELSGEVRPTEGLRIAANYTYLKTDEQKVAGAPEVREIRRPKHTANLYADWASGPLVLGGSLAYVGNRTDKDFDQYPAPTVMLHDYVLASARIAYRVTEALELFGRVENAGDAHYQDAVGYATPGRTVYAGLRVRLGD